MILVAATDHFRLAVNYLEGQTEDGQPHERNLDKAEKILNEILNYNIGNPIVLYSLGSLELAKGNYGYAIQVLSQVTAMQPTNGSAWNNLGLAWKEVPDFGKAETALKMAVKHCPDECRADILCNLSALNINRNRASNALEYAEKALAIDPKHQKAIWHRGLAGLELRQWATAWDDHETRLSGGAPGEIAHRNYHGPDGETPEWDGKSPGFIVIHGEQGLGDEIMFASCISDAMKVEGARFVIEPGPRLENLFKRSFPNAKVYGTHDNDGRAWIGELGRPDFKVALGSLPKFFRRSGDAFPGTSYLVPSKSARAWWGDKLRALGRKPNIGIAWQGGVQQTRYDARSFHPAQYAPLFQSVDANWISLQYDKTAQHCVSEVREKLGVKLVHWPKAVEQKDPDTGKLSDIDELVALISKLDLVVTVCQTAVHIAGALGVPTICLTPSEPSWRYGAGDWDDMPWYGAVRQIRQAKGSNDWTPVIEEVTANVQAFLKTKDAVAE
jgi:tetratricopeptide (TPR) repeat protein